MTELRNILHLIEANMTCTHVSMAVNTGATWRSRIIVMNQLDHTRLRRRKFLNILNRLYAAGKYVACINTNTETRIRKITHELNELLVLGQGLCSLTRRCL